MESKYVSLPEDVNYEAPKDGKTFVNHSVEKVVREVVTRGAFNEAIHMWVDSPAELQDLIQHLMIKIIGNQSSKVTITHSARKRAQVAVAAEVNFNDQSVDKANQNKQGTPLSSLRGLSPDSLHSSSKEGKRK